VKNKVVQYKGREKESGIKVRMREGGRERELMTAKGRSSSINKTFSNEI